MTESSVTVEALMGIDMTGKYIQSMSMRSRLDWELRIFKVMPTYAVC